MLGRDAVTDDENRPRPVVVEDDVLLKADLDRILCAAPRYGLFRVLSSNVNRSNGPFICFLGAECKNTAIRTKITMISKATPINTMSLDSIPPASTTAGLN
ncbi:unnamed protein product [Haemonchus placei]|uniref:Uncharacterized protein n=1 Tax=Haemonchus placei TaxID=6290 RepID=A0A3P7XMC7_HAEPC|nr:unnamed protein product [Haemonchus placei]